jgi:hypothetical protein
MKNYSTSLHCNRPFLIEEASLWLAGDSDIFGVGKQLSSIAGEIVAILTADEEEEPRPLS